MSYDVRIMNPDGSVAQMRSRAPQGGTHQCGGTTEAWFNITYNYSTIFGNLVRDLHGKRVTDTVQRLFDFLAANPFEKPHPDYWYPSLGNAQEAVRGLLAMATECPDGTWEVT